MSKNICSPFEKRQADAEAVGEGGLGDSNQPGLTYKEQMAVVKKVEEKSAAQKVADLKKASGFREKILKKELTFEVTSLAVEKVLDDLHFNDRMRNVLVDIMRQNIGGIANGAIEETGCRYSSDLVFGYKKSLDELRVKNSDHSLEVNKEYIGGILVHIYRKVADEVNDMGYSNKRVNKAADWFEKKL